MSSVLTVLTVLPRRHSVVPGGRRLLAADGVPLWACHDPAEAAPTGAPARDLAVVLVHGFTLSATSAAVRRLVGSLSRHAGVVSVDLRGHGRSGGRSTVGDLEVRDVDAAVGWARLLGYRRVATLGFSLGAACVLRHAALAHGRGAGEAGDGGDGAVAAPVVRHRVDAVAAVSGPARWNDRATPAMRTLHAGVRTAAGRAVLRTLGTRVAAAGWDPWPVPPDVAAARVPPTPLLLVHGDADSFFGLEHPRWLHTAAGPASQLWVETGMGHAEVAVSPDLARRLGCWLQTATRA